MLCYRCREDVCMTLHVLTRDLPHWHGHLPDLIFCLYHCNMMEVILVYIFVVHYCNSVNVECYVIGEERVCVWPYWQGIYHTDIVICKTNFVVYHGNSVNEGRYVKGEERMCVWPYCQGICHTDIVICQTNCCISLKSC